MMIIVESSAELGRCKYIIQDCDCDCGHNVRDVNVVVVQSTKRY